MQSDHAPSDDLRDVYERRAELQYAAPKPLPDPRLDRKFQRVCELVAEQLPCERYLDAGCGDGRYLAALPVRPARVVATDISEKILSVAREAAGFEVETVRANVESLPFPDASFDVILCTQVVEHLLDPPRGVAELARVLAPGGHLVLTTDHRGAWVTKVLNAPRTAAVAALRLRRPYPFPHRDFSRAETVALAEGAGLEVERSETFRFSLRPPLNRRPVVLALNALERRLPANGLGDLVAVVARKPG